MWVCNWLVMFVMAYSSLFDLETNRCWAALSGRMCGVGGGTSIRSKGPAMDDEYVTKGEGLRAPGATLCNDGNCDDDDDGSNKAIWRSAPVRIFLLSLLLLLGK